MPTEPEILSSAFWDDLYNRQETRWDLGYPSTPLKEYIDQLTNKHIRILIPGAGNGYEALYLAEQGFTDITVIDISTVVTQKLKQRLSIPDHSYIKVVTGDFFSLEGIFDLVIEQTFFCALHPSLRKQFAEKVKTLLAGNGKLVGLLFNKDFDTNPPFGGNTEEYRQLFSSVLRIQKLEACYNSIPARSGSELFIIASKL
ncbi:MAG: methyltransferase domain-containing protein [Bacteroidota bacterium]